MLPLAAVAALILSAATTSLAQVADVEPPTPPDRVHFEGLVGARLDACAENRLLKMDEEALLAGFRHRPGSQEWIGEHVGKFLHAATLAWVYSGNPALREKVDRVTTELLKTQLADGYLGTYTPDQYWTSWDVWVHKYCLYGLVTVHRYTGNEAALAGARRIGDLLCRTFGPGKRDIIASGTHLGMAATSVMEPMMLLYDATREPRYLDFCRYLVAAWKQPNGPHIVESLLDHGQVSRTANGKAYEMMSNLVGLCELYRATGEKDYLQACLRAWQDIVDNRMYLTGGTSLGEHFQADHHLPNSGMVSENCAQVTWLQLNAQLLRLTGEARFAEVLETLVYNHLFASQHPGGWEICYFTPLEGRKPYDGGINCCTSSNSRGLELIPTFAYSVQGDQVYANLHAPGRLTFAVKGVEVTLKQTAAYPNEGRLRYEVASAGKAPFRLYIRVPSWCQGATVKLNGKRAETDDSRPGYLGLRRTWSSGDTVDVDLPMPVVTVRGDHENDGFCAVRRGPVVYALDTRDNPKLPPVAAIGLEAKAEAQVVEATAEERTWEGERLIVMPAEVAPQFRHADAPVSVRLRPFADAGSTRTAFRVWLPPKERLASLSFSLLMGGQESWSREGNVVGSLVDGDLNTFRVTFDGRRQDQDWYAVTLDQPVSVSRVVYAHGNTFHDGGWFDAAQGKPRVQIQRTAGGPWEDAATLDSYPDTTATDSKGVRPGQTFEVRFTPVRTYGIRLVGVGAGGDNPNQCFSSCAELQAF